MQRHYQQAIPLSELQAVLKRSNVHYHHGLSHSGYCIKIDAIDKWAYLHRGSLENMGAIVPVGTFEPSGPIVEGWR